MAQLNADVLDVRLQAVFALSAFAVSKFNISSASAFPCREVAETVHKYVDEQSLKYKALLPDNLLPAIVKSALSDSGRRFWRKKGPSFGISLASIISVLLDYRIFTSPRSLKLVFLVLSQVVGRSGRNGVHTEMWKILIWAFSRIPTNEKHLEDRMAQEWDIDRWRDTRERAYRLLKQEVKNGLGISLVRVLLRCAPHGKRDLSDVEKAIALVEDLLTQGDGSAKHDAMMLLERLMSGIGAPPPSRTMEGVELEIVFSKDLLDGSLLRQNWTEANVTSTVVSTDDIQPLFEEEASAFWHRLSQCWFLIVQDLLQHSEGSLPVGLFVCLFLSETEFHSMQPNIIQIWQSLLLVQSQLTRSHQHLTAPSSFARHIASIISGFSMPLDSPDAQIRYLTMISKLWSVVKDVFTKPWLSSTAEKIFASLLKKRFDMSIDDVKKLWSHVCEELVSMGIPTLLHVLHTRSLNHCLEEKEVTKCIWVVMARNGEELAKDQVVDAAEDDWMDLIHLLAMPFGCVRASHLIC